MSRIASDEKESLARLHRNPDFHVWKQWVQRQRDGEYLALAKQLYHNPDQIQEHNLLALKLVWKRIAELLNAPAFAAKATEREQQRRDES